MNLIQDLALRSLRNGFKFRLEDTRRHYNQLSSYAFVGIGVSSFVALYFGSEFADKSLVYLILAYCFVFPVHYRLAPPGFPLWFSMLQLPLGLLLIVLLQAIMPAYNVYMTGFLYPIAFVFSFYFHRSELVLITFLVTFVASAWILALRAVPMWMPYMVMTVGSTLTIGLIVHATVSRILELANTDALTGLLNRRSWENEMQYLIALARRERLPVSVIYLDLDNFKQINDTHGHYRGDKVLIQIARQIESVARQSDRVARWGGDEFVMSLPNTSLEQADALVTRLKQAVDVVGFSSGIVELRPDETLDELLQRADQMMYAVKLGHQARHRAGDRP